MLVNCGVCGGDGVGGGGGRSDFGDSSLRSCCLGSVCASIAAYVYGLDCALGLILLDNYTYLNFL